MVTSSKSILQEKEIVCLFDFDSTNRTGDGSPCLLRTAAVHNHMSTTDGDDGRRRVPLFQREAQRAVVVGYTC
jgi:hypothetical protein